jgi:hypothetical protein
MRIIHVIIAIVWLCFSVQAQETKISDEVRVALTPVLPTDSMPELPAGARSILANRLRQLANANGYGGTAYLPQFILAARPALLEKKVAGTAPTKIWVEIELTLYIANQFAQVVFSTTSVTIRGVGATDTEAYMDAYKGFSIQKNDIKEFAKKGRTEITNFYNTQCDLIMKRVDMLTNINEADAALDMLLSIPDVSTSCFNKAAEKAPAVFKAAADQQCQKFLQAAKTAWANAPNRAGADKATYYLNFVLPQSRCQGDADKLLTEIKTKMLEIEQWDRKQYTDQIELMRLYIQALRDIGVAYGEGQPNTQIHVKGWLW